MVLLAAELSRPNSPLMRLGARVYSKNYEQYCNEALRSWNWHPNELQHALEEVRSQAISNNRANWLASHKAFPGIIKRLNQLNAEGYELVVLTTKGSKFTAELLDHFQLKPKLIFGHESGSKSNVLLHLSKKHIIRGFLEDRRATLETVSKNSQLSSITYFLASWGYLKPDDTKHLPTNIHLLDTKTFMTPLASWP